MPLACLLCGVAGALPASEPCCSALSKADPEELLCLEPFLLGTSAVPADVDADSPAVLLLPLAAAACPLASACSAAARISDSCARSTYISVSLSPSCFSSAAMCSRSSDTSSSRACSRARLLSLSLVLSELLMLAARASCCCCCWSRAVRAALLLLLSGCEEETWLAPAPLLSAGWLAGAAEALPAALD